MLVFAMCSDREEEQDGSAAASLVEAYSQAQAAANKAQQTLHISLPVGHEPGSGSTGLSANSALATAAGLAGNSPPLVVLPLWVRMPSYAAQHWLAYTALTVLSAWAGVLIYK